MQGAQVHVNSGDREDWPQGTHNYLQIFIVLDSGGAALPSPNGFFLLGLTFQWQRLPLNYSVQ